VWWPSLFQHVAGAAGGLCLDLMMQPELEQASTTNPASRFPQRTDIPDKKTFTHSTRQRQPPLLILKAHLRYRPDF
jgi:hypothetical protein